MPDANNYDVISKRASDLYYQISDDGIVGDVAKAELRALHFEARDVYQKSEIESAMLWADKYYGHRWKPWENPDNAKYRLLIRLNRAQVGSLLMGVEPSSSAYHPPTR